MPPPEPPSVKPAQPSTRLPKKLPSRRAVAVLTLAVAALLGAAGTAVFVWAGVYDVSVTALHTQPVYRLLEVAMDRSVRHHAKGIVAPPLDGAATQQRGAACYRDHCLQCHGGPGVSPDEIGLSMQPLPGPLLDAAVRFEPHELYWITREGIKMSGMPAWRHRLRDDELWAVVSFVDTLPKLTPAEFRRLTAQVPADCPGVTQDAAREPGDAERGKVALHQHACTSCHVIPGVVGSDVHVGPPLEHYGRRELIVGRLPNTPEALTRWIREPHAVDPQSAMPALPMGEQAARDMAAYLATLR